MPPPSEHLDEAIRALESADLAAAMAALLDAWRALRAPAIAEAIDGLSARVELPSIDPRTSGDLREAFLSVASRGRDVDVPRLLAALPHRPFRDVYARVERLLPRPADPRVGLELSRLLAARSMNSTIGTTTWNQLFTLMERSADPRMRPFLEASLAAPVPGDYGKQLERGARRVLAALPDPVPAVDGVAREKLARITESIRSLPVVTAVEERPRPRGPSTPDPEAALLSAIYEEPDEDAPRLVYADWLAARGDPRGELIHLQFKERDGGASPKEQKRIASLLRKHLTQWLGPIEPAISRRNITFERGFLSRCQISFPTAEIEARLTDHPAWSTVSWLWNHEGDERFLLQCHLRGLRTLPREIPLSLFAEMASRDRPYGIEDICLDVTAPTEAERRALMTLPAFPRLHRLRLARDEERGPISPADLPWLFEGALGTRLQSIEPPYDSDPCSWVPDLEPLPELRRIAFGRGYSAALLRDPGSKTWTVELRWQSDPRFRAKTLKDIDRWMVPLRERLEGIRLSKSEGARDTDDLQTVAKALRRRVARVDIQSH